MNPKKKAVQRPLGSVFNPQVVGADYRVRFEYEPGNSFEVTLAQNGTLEIRMSGSHSDMMATHHHVSNACAIVPRRWSNELSRYAELLKEEPKGTE